MQLSPLLLLHFPHRRCCGLPSPLPPLPQSSFMHTSSSSFNSFPFVCLRRGSPRRLHSHSKLDGIERVKEVEEEEGAKKDHPVPTT
jgi:hypothetical protein